MILGDWSAASAVPPPVARHESGGFVLRLVIGDVDRTYAAALASLVFDEPDLDLVGTADSVEGVVDLVVRGDADVAAVDLALPKGGIVGVHEGLRQANSNCRLVVMTALLSPAGRAIAARGGATEVVAKAEGQAVIAAIRAQGG